jgi:pimeloyl-[acyl-carrier protein] methyl ester esterase
MISASVFLHGWGTHPVIWQPLLARFPQARACALPGYAGSAPAESLDDMAASIANRLQERTSLVGWSLGGLVAMRVARMAPEKIASLVLIGATPCFVNRSDWPHGVDDAVFEQFSRSLAEDYAGTIRRFLSLQAQGSDDVRVVLSELRRKLLSEPQPDMAVLESGLSILRNADLRAEVSALAVPVKLVHGTGDKLAPVQAARWLRDAVPGAVLHEVKGAGHAPFLSHAGEVADVIAPSVNGHG